LLINAVFMPDRNACFEMYLKYVTVHAKCVPYHHGVAQPQSCGWSRPVPGVKENCKYVE
jgi:hypothetical protein